MTRVDWIAEPWRTRTPSGLATLTLGAAALIGAALCPTDPVLASSVVTGGAGRGGPPRPEPTGALPGVPRQ